MLFIPANSSDTSVYQILADNDERGLIFETEEDTLAYSFSSDFGNFSDGLRKAFHHEPISYHRRKDDEHVDISTQKLSAVLSGTPRQLQALVRDAENGLFSRYILYKLESELSWKNVFEGSVRMCLNEQFRSLGQIYYGFFEKLCKAPQLTFTLTDRQAREFNTNFSSSQMEMSIVYGEGMVASIRRLGLIIYRIAMVLSTLRMMENGQPDCGKLVCQDIDFATAMHIATILEMHTAAVFEDLCGKAGSVGARRSNAWLKFIQKLPDEFTGAGYSSMARTMGITDRTSQRYVSVAIETGVVECWR